MGCDNPPAAGFNADSFSNGALVSEDSSGNWYLHGYDPVGDNCQDVYVSRLNLNMATPNAQCPQNLSGVQIPVWACAADYSFYDSGSWVSDSTKTSEILFDQGGIFGGQGNFDVAAVSTNSGTEYLMIYQHVDGDDPGEFTIAVSGSPYGPFVPSAVIQIPECSVGMNPPYGSPSIFEENYRNCRAISMHLEVDPSGNATVVFSYYQDAAYRYPGSAPTRGHIQFATISTVCVLVDSSSNCFPSGFDTVTSQGKVSAYDSAASYGDLSAFHLYKPIVGIGTTPDGRGYWLVASDGGIFAIGDAQFFGSTGALVLAKPIVGMASTEDGRGYWLVASDGGIFSFGDAAFDGSCGQAATLCQSIADGGEIVGMIPTPDGCGYWLAGSEGDVTPFGQTACPSENPYVVGSPGPLTDATCSSPTSLIVSISHDQSLNDTGYWLAESNGAVLSCGNASAPNVSTNPSPIVAMAAL